MLCGLAIRRLLFSLLIPNRIVRVGDLPTFCRLFVSQRLRRPQSSYRVRRAGASRQGTREPAGDDQAVEGLELIAVGGAATIAAASVDACVLTRHKTEIVAAPRSRASILVVLVPTRAMKGVARWQRQLRRLARKKSLSRESIRGGARVLARKDRYGVIGIRGRSDFRRRGARARFGEQITKPAA